MLDRAQRARHRRAARGGRAHPRRARSDDARRSARRCPGSTRSAPTSSSPASPSPPRCWRALEARELLVSRYGIREGLLLERARVDADGRRSGRGARALGARVRRALPLRGAARAAGAAARAAALRRARRAARLRAGRPRRSLADAALLHDVGYHINYEQHHKHSYHLILHAELLGMTPSEQVRDRERRALPPRRAAASGSTATSASSTARCATSVVRLVGDPARRRRLRPRARRRRGRAEGALAPARDPHHADRRAQGAGRCASSCGARSRKSQLLARSPACRSRSSAPDGDGVRRSNDVGDATTSEPRAGGASVAASAAAAASSDGADARRRDARRCDRPHGSREQPHVRRRARSPSRLALHVAAVGVEVPRLPVVRRDTSRAALRSRACSAGVLDRHDRLHAPVEVARHPVGRADVELVVAAVARSRRRASARGSGRRC